MSDFVRINQRGEFELDGKRFLLNCAVYFGRRPGTPISQWLSDPHWAKNREDLKRDFELMESLKINSIGLFVRAEDLIAKGKPIERQMRRLDEVIKIAAMHHLRVILYPGPFINTVEIFYEMTGQAPPADAIVNAAETEIRDNYHSGARRVCALYHPAFHEAVFNAYVHVMAVLSERYRDEPYVFGYVDRIERFVPTFGRRDKLPGLERIWQHWLASRYASFAAFREAHPNLAEHPQSFAEVKLPQDIADGFSMRDSRAYEYALMQRTLVGEVQGRFDAEIKKLAPKQIVWTAFEGVSLMTPILDAYIHTPKVLEAVWAEYYPMTGFGNAYRVQLPQAEANCLLISEFDVARLPAYSAQAYLFTRWLRTTMQCPVILCHGWQMEAERAESPWEYEQQILIDRTNRAILQANGDGWAYWCWSDDALSLTATVEEQRTQRHKYQPQGETMGLIRWDGTLRPAAVTVRDYSRMFENPPALHGRSPSDVLLLLPEPKMVIEQGALALQTATGVAAALLRCGTLPDVRWTATTREVVSASNLQQYKLVVLGDSTYRRDHQQVPGILAEYVRQGGVLFWPVHTTEWLEDELGSQQQPPALSELAGCSGPPEHLAGLGELQWYVHPRFEHYVSPPAGKHRCQIESDVFTWLTPDATGVEIIASAKFAAPPPPKSNAPLLYRFPLGKGTVYVFTWTFNVFRDDGTRMLYGGSEWDWTLRPVLESAGVSPELTTSPGTELRNAAFKQMTEIRRRF